MEVQNFRDKILGFTMKDFLGYLGKFFMYRNDPSFLGLSCIAILLLLYLSFYCFRSKAHKFSGVFTAYRNLIIFSSIISSAWIVYMVIGWFENKYEEYSTPYILVFSLAVSATALTLLRSLYNRHRYMDIIPLAYTTAKQKILAENALRIFRNLRLWMTVPLLTLVATLLFIISTGVIPRDSPLIALVFDNSSSMSSNMARAKTIVPESLKNVNGNADVVITTLPPSKFADMDIAQLVTHASFEDEKISGITRFCKRSQVDSVIYSLTDAGVDSHIIQSLWKTYLGIKEHYPKIKDRGGATLIISTDGGSDTSNLISGLRADPDYVKIFPPQNVTLVAFEPGRIDQPFFSDARAIGYHVIDGSGFESAVVKSVNGTNANIYFIFCMTFCCLPMLFLYFIKPLPVERLNS